MSNPFTTKDPLFDIIKQVVLGEKKLTDAELKKREEIVLAIKRENPDMEKSRAYAIATAKAKKVAEEVELDEAMKPFTDADHATADKHGTKIEKNLENIKKVPTKHLQYLHHHNMGYASSGGYLHHALPHIETELKKRGKKPLSDEDGEKVFNESVEQIDEVGNTLKGQIDLRNYKEKAKKDMGDAGEKLWYKSVSDKDTKGKIALIRQRDKRRKGIQRADARIKFEEVNLDEQLENFWEAYTTMFNEAEDQQQNLLLRAMAKDPTDLMKMKRAIKMGDKALTNPALRQEILKMLDQMMHLTTGDPSLLQRTKAGFQKAKKLKMPEEVQLEEGFTHYRYSGHVNGKDYEVHIPRKHDLGDYSDHQLHKKISRENPHLHHHEVTAIVHSGGEEDSHVEVEHKGQKHKHHVYNEQEPDYIYEEVELDEAREAAYNEKQIGFMIGKHRNERDDLVKKASDPNTDTETKKLARYVDGKYGRALKRVKTTPVAKFIKKRKGDWNRVLTVETAPFDGGQVKPRRTDAKIRAAVGALARKARSEQKQKNKKDNK